MQQTLDKKMHLEANFINHVKIAKQSIEQGQGSAATQLALVYGDEEREQHNYFKN